MLKNVHFLLISLQLIFLQGWAWAVEASNITFKIPEKKEFAEFWLQDTAEITHYKLEQARYGEIHNGHSVHIFVTEPFNTAKQVKDDPPYKYPNTQTVLKHNYTKNFNTGIYPYSIMTSSFSPIAPEKSQKPLKVNMSMQEWCGHVFSQLNSDWLSYKFQQFSYFEKDSDLKYNIKQAIPEDGIWNMIRLNPNKLPIGSFNIIPALANARLMHVPVKAEKAIGTIVPDKDNIVKYAVEYVNSKRKLTIAFDRNFPFTIEWWEDTYKDGFRKNRKESTTRGAKVQRIKLDYWKKNKNADSDWRIKLKLD